MSLVVFVAFFAQPIVWMVLTSLKPRKSIMKFPPDIFPMPPTLENYSNLVKLKAWGGEEIFTKQFPNTLIIALLSTAVTIGVSVLAAYSLSRYSFAGRRTLTFSIISIRMLPPIAAVLPLFIYYSRLGLVDTHLGLVLAYGAYNSPLTILMLKSFVDEIPVDLEEAAMIDGSTRIKAFLLVTLPLVAPGIGATSVFSFLTVWNDFQFSYFLSELRAGTLATLAPTFVTEVGVYWGEMAAYGTIVMIPAVIFAIVAQKALVRGLTLGAVKM